MEQFKELSKLIEDTKEDVEKFFGQNNGTAGVRVRKAMLRAKNLAHDIRKKVSEVKQEKNKE